MKKLVILALLIVGCAKDQPIDDPHEIAVAPVVVAPAAPAVKDLGVPTDAQIMRDAAVELNKWRSMGMPVKNPTIKVTVDEFEKNRVDVIVTGRTSEGKVQVFLVYLRQNDFFALGRRTSYIGGR